MPQKRRLVDNEHPIIQIRGFLHEPDYTFKDVRLNLPENIRDKVTFLCNGVIPKMKDKDQIETLDKFLGTADEIGAECLFQVAGWNSNLEYAGQYCTDPEVIDLLLERHPSLKVIEVCETSCCVGMLPQARKDYFCSLLKVCHKHGAYFVNKDMGWPWQPHSFIEIGRNEGVMDTIREYGSSLILLDKQNGSAKFYQSQSLCLGYWLSDLIPAWGFNSEHFLHVEAGSTRRHGDLAAWRLKSSPLEDVPGSGYMSVSVCPETLYLQQFFPAISAGATFYSYESPTYFINGKEHSPLFTRLYYPILERMFYDHLIPSKEEVKEKIKVAYHVDDIQAPELEGWGNEFYRGICASETPDEIFDKNKAMFEWLPRSGKYYFIPFLPTLAGEKEKEKFPSVFNSGDYAKFKTREDKLNYLDKLYGFDNPDKRADVEGDAWGVNIGNRWFVMNPREDGPESAEFSLNLKNRAVKLSGILSEACTMLISDNALETKLTLNNLNCDNSDRIWGGDFSQNGYGFDVEEYFKWYFHTPDFGTKYKSVVVIEGEVDVKSISGDHCYTVNTSYDYGVTKLEILHNGTVEITL